MIFLDFKNLPFQQGHVHFFLFTEVSPILCILYILLMQGFFPLHGSVMYTILHISLPHYLTIKQTLKKKKKKVKYQIIAKYLQTYSNQVNSLMSHHLYSCFNITLIGLHTPAGRSSTRQEKWYFVFTVPPNT